MTARSAKYGTPLYQEPCVGCSKSLMVDENNAGHLSTFFLCADCGKHSAIQSLLGSADTILFEQDGYTFTDCCRGQQWQQALQCCPQCGQLHQGTLQ
jgi:hypothetical protein